MPGMRTLLIRDDHTCSVSGCRMLQAGCSLPRQFCLVPLARSVHVLNQRVYVGLSSAGLAPVAAAPDGKFIGIPFWRRVSVLNSHPLTSCRTGLARSAPNFLPVPNGN